MPSLQVVDLSELPADKPEPTQVERLFSEYKKYTQERNEGEEVGKFAKRYKEALQKQEDVNQLIPDLMSNVNIGPTKRIEMYNMIRDGQKQANEEVKTSQKEYKDAVDDQVQNLVDQGYPVKEAIQYVNAPPSVQNRMQANHIEQVNRGLRKPKVESVPTQENVPMQGTNVIPEAPTSDVLKVQEWPDLPPPKDMTTGERVKWENTNQASNNKELVKTQAKKKALENNDILLKSMTTLNESNKLPKELDSWIIDPESGGVRTSAQLAGKVNKETALYAKNLAQFIKGAKDVFGARVSNFEVGAFLDQLPSLLNSEQGRRLILKQMELTNQLEQVYNNTLNDALKKYSRKGNYADIVAMVDQKTEEASADLINKLNNVVEASNYLDTMASNPDKFKDTVLMQSPEGKFKAVRKDKVSSAPEGWSVY